MRYPGGKGRSYQFLINQMPPHETFVETHLGGGAVMRRKRPARINIGIDADPNVVRRWSGNAPQATHVIHGDAAAILPTLRLGLSDLVYSDPPYLPTTRKRARCYRHDCGIEDHARLLDVLQGLDCMVMISGYRSGLYDDRLASWRRLDYEAVTQAGNRVESLWLNFAESPVLHDYSFIGSGFRDREGKRRLRASMGRRLAVLDPTLRNAVIADLAPSNADALRAALRRLED